jgi:hypothetical protein
MQNHDPRGFGRTIACATIAMLVLTAATPLAMAGPGQGPKEASTIAASNDATGLIAARHYRYYRSNGGSAAGLAAMGMAIGTIGAIAAQQQRSDYYNNGYYNNGYDNNGYGYQSAPRYYGNGPYYGGGYYRR